MISLIVATLGRVAELERLLGSLDQQSYRDFEVLVVDQNPDARLAPILQCHPGLALQHLRSSRGLSRARNIALPRAGGDLIAFPDDDCWYPWDLLASVRDWFESHDEAGFLITGVGEQSLPVAESELARSKFAGSKLAVSDPSSGPCPCTKKNVWQCAMSTALFLRQSVAIAVGGFDENLGVGAPTAYQSGEETDYLLRALDHGFCGYCEPSLTVHHPPLASIDRLQKTTYAYALSTGRLQRLHHYPLHQLGWHLVRSLGGAAIRLCQGDLARSRVYVLRGAGQCAGYLSRPSDLRRNAVDRGK